jgi:hypothetical protein
MAIKLRIVCPQKRCGELQELYDDETVLRKRAEKKCQELKEKCAQLERDALDTNKALEDSSRVISEQMVRKLLLEVWFVFWRLFVMICDVRQH